MQKKPSENLDSHEHIPLSSENVETESKVEHVVRDIQEQVTDTLYPTGSDTKKGNSDEMVEYEKGLSQNSLNKKILREYEKDQYRNVLLQNMDKLMDIGLIIGDDGKYYFHNFASKRQWPQIGGKNLANFPNTEFLRERGIIDQSACTITNKSQVEKLFAVLLGAEKVATEEDYKKLFASQLEGIVPELKKIGLEFREGKYYFHNLQTTTKWQKIVGKNLIHFPNTEFLRKYRIIDQDKNSMFNRSHLAKLMEILLGVEITTEEDYKKLFAYQLEEIIPELEKIGLKMIEGKYYFGDLWGFPKWPKIEGKSLKNFPNAEFLRKLGIIDQDKNSMFNRSHLAKLFKVLGFEVWDEPPKSRKTRKQHEVEDITSYIAALKAIIPELKKIGLELRDGKYYFHNFAGNLQWPKIVGKNLIHFPNAEFLRKLGIIDQKARYMTSRSQLAKLMEVLLGVEIATEEDYKKLFAYQLEEIIPELEKIGLEFREGKYYFNNLQVSKKWPKIEGKRLKNFPNGEFLRKHGILKTHQHAMTNNNQLAKLFHVLGFPVDEKLLEKIQNEK